MLFTAVTPPLWASYLARVHAWIVILQNGGMLSCTIQYLGRCSERRLLQHGDVDRLLYLWLPFMIVPVYGAIERIPTPFWRHRGTSARSRRTPPASRRRWHRPGIVWIDLHVLADVGDFITAADRGFDHIHRAM